MSLQALYEGEVLLPEMLTRMRELGFQLVSLEEIFSDAETGEQLQTDGIFHRIAGKTR